MSGSGSYPSMNGANSNHKLRMHPQHHDLINYIFESWDKVSKEFHHGARAGGATVAYYQEREQNPQLKDFQPFDLEAWWGRRLVQNLTNNGS